LTPAAPFPSRWKVADPILIADTFSSLIWKVRLDDGTLAVIKDLKPIEDIEDELRGAHLLEWRRGHGAVRLLDRDANRMLVEYAGDRHLSDDIAAHGDQAATEIAAGVIARLHGPSGHPVPGDLQPLRDRFASLFAKAESHRKVDQGSLYVEAAMIAERLLAEQRDIRPLHGDLHHDNIMHGSRGWQAIDPKGVLGDSCFDAANLFYNPLDHTDLCLDPERIAFMAETFARTLDRNVPAVLDHAIAYGCLSAAWHSEDGNSVDEERQLSIARAICAVRRFSAG
jgi:streptomycin 6-kinase